MSCLLKDLYIKKIMFKYIVKHLLVSLFSFSPMNPTNEMKFTSSFISAAIYALNV